MSELQTLLNDLQSGDDLRAENASAQLPSYGAAAFSALKILRQSPDADIRWWAVRTIAQFPNSAELVEELLIALSDESNEVRQCAALAIASHPDPRAVSPLIQLLFSPDGMLSGLAAHALIRIGKPAVSELIETAQSGTPSARIEAVRALSEIRDVRAIPVLMKIIEQDSLVSRYWAEQGLNNLGLGMVYIQPE